MKSALTEKQTEDALNRLAEKYPSFRVVCIFETLEGCDSITQNVLAWFNDKDFALFKTERSQID